MWFWVGNFHKNIQLRPSLLDSLFNVIEILKIVMRDAGIIHNQLFSK